MKSGIKKNPVIKISLQLYGGVGSVIPNGVKETLRIEIVDEMAAFKFNDADTSRAFAEHEAEHGIESVFSEKLQKAICKYPGLSQEKLKDMIQKKLGELKK